MTKALGRDAKAVPQIVWRNPEPVWCWQRWESWKRSSDRSVHVVQQFISAGEFGSWTTTSNLEVVTCGDGA
jgi:hypothetical protein